MSQSFSSRRSCLMNVQRLKKKNSIDIARKLSLKSVLVTISLVLAACQSAPDQNTKKVQTKKTVHHVQSPVVKKRVSADGIQDIDWQITQISGHKAKFFTQWPTLSLNSAIKTVSGHTGCNAVFGRYTFDFSQQKLDMQVNAGHLSCDGALAQEAELVDALQRIQRFQLVGNTLYLLDQSGQRLIQAQKK